MKVFIDTSAFYAVLDAAQAEHPRADRAWRKLLTDGSPLITHNYVLLEAAALIQHRLGVAALRTFHEDIVPLLEVEWIGEDRHAAAMEAVLIMGKRKLSLVDCVSFQTLRRHAGSLAFCFDSDFKANGFQTIP